MTMAFQPNILKSSDVCCAPEITSHSSLQYKTVLVIKMTFLPFLSGKFFFHFMPVKEGKQICVNIVPQMQVLKNNNKETLKILQTRKDASL